MWIIQKSLLRSWSGAPDTAALEWDSSELSETCAQSLTRRSNFSAAKSWRAVWKRGKSTLPRFGRILNLSHANAFEEWWTSSLPVTPASHSARRAKGKAKKTQDTSGPSYKGQLQLFDQDSASLRTSPDILPSGLATSCTTFQNWTTKLRRDCSRREKSASRTRDNASSSWPTIRAQEPGWTSDDYGDNLMKRMARMRSSEVWPTPTEMSRVRDDAQMQKCLDFRATKGKNSVPLYLEETVLASESARPTPVVDDSKNNANPSQFRRLSKGKPRALNLNAKVATSPPPDPDQSNTGGNPPESWRTPTALEAGARVETLYTKDGEPAKIGQRAYRKTPSGEMVLQSQTLNQHVVMDHNWATPQASDHVEGARTAPESNQKCLGRDLATQEQGSAWPTPNTPSGGGTAGCPMGMNGGLAHRQMLKGVFKGNAPKLSPRWVEVLMGLPIGWTDPTCSRPITPWEAVYTAASMNSEPSETE